jgi:hypothetical protein
MFIIIIVVIIIIIIIIIITTTTTTITIIDEQAQLSQYNDELRSGWSGFDPRPTASRPILGPSQAPLQWIPGALSPGANLPGREADHLHLVSRSRIVELYLYSHIHLHAMVF